MPTTLSENEPITVYQLPSPGAEDVLVGEHDGLVYTGTADGKIYALDPETGDARVVCETGGRPLGLEWLPDGRLLICDTRRGVLAYSWETDEVEELVTEVNGKPMLFCNNAAAHSDGTIYFSDSSRRYGVEHFTADLIEDTRSGRLLARRPDGSVEVLIDGLRFANGVALPPDESYVAVAETGGRTIVRHWLTGTQRGRTDVLVHDLPGHPDNLSLGSDGLLWVAIAERADPLLAFLIRRVPRPLRAVLAKVPAKLLPPRPRSVRVMAFTPEGRLVHDRQLDSTDFHFCTGVREHGGRVWLGSLMEPAVAAFDVH